MGDGESAAGLTKLLAYGGDELVGFAVGADQPDHGADAGVERGHAVGDLRLRNDHLREWIAVEAAIVNVADDTDDLAGGFLKLRTDAFADDDLLADGIVFGPVLLGHRLLMMTTPAAPAKSRSVKSRPAQDRNLENVEIAR